MRKSMTLTGLCPALLLLLLAPLSGCDSSTTEADILEQESVPDEGDGETISDVAYDASYEPLSVGSGSYSADEEEFDQEEFDEDAAREEAEDEVASEGYDYSYGCTQDCSGHQAGWAYQDGQGYGSYPSGNSRSFEEGRIAYDEAVDERVEEMRSDFESEQE